MTEQQTTDLAVVEATINLPVLTNREEVMEIMAENMSTMGNHKMQFDKVKIPSSGAVSFEVIGEDGEPEPVKELKGVVIDAHPCNACWKESGTTSNTPPDCSSMDGETGSGSEALGIPAGQKCATCPYNQWGSDPKGGRGKHCKNMIRLALLQDQCTFPLLLSLPPTSIGAWTSHLQRLMNKGAKPFYGVVTSIKLKKVESRDGNPYSEAVISKFADLRPEERKAIRQYAEILRPALRTVALDAVDYNTVADATHTTDSAEDEAY